MQAAIRDLNELLPQVKTLAQRLIELCKAQNITIQMIETYRTQERQNALYEQGRTTPGNIVTWTKTSKHTERRAFDIVIIVDGRAEWNNRKLYSKVGELGISIGLTWGGEWKEPDLGHFQLDGVIEVEHWAEKYYDFLIGSGMDIKEKRFDDKVTRGEIFKLIALIKGFVDK